MFGKPAELFSVVRSLGLVGALLASLVFAIVFLTEASDGFVPEWFGEAMSLFALALMLIDVVVVLAYFIAYAAFSASVWAYKRKEDGGVEHLWDDELDDR